MKITRSQLRKLINEIRIKPAIPNVPSSDDLGKIDDLARSEDNSAMAGVMAHTFGYPEDRNYVEDLKDYDDIENIARTERLYDEIVQIIIDIYDQEVYNFSLDRLIYNEMNSGSDSDFDKFLKRLARDMYVYMSKKYAGSGIPHPLEHSVIIKGGSGISRIYQTLKNVK